MIKTFDLYGDGIGKVDYVEHMGSDLTVVNSARVSFGVEKMNWMKKIKNLLTTLLNTDTPLRWNTILLLFALWFLCSFVLNTIVIALGLIMK